MGQFVVVHNPQAKLNRKHPERAEQLADIVGSRGVVHETTDLGNLPLLARELAAKDIDVLCICGGDGTNQVVLTALLPAFQAAGRPLPPISLLKGGSMNTIGWSLGLRGSAEAVLSELVGKYDRGEANEVVQQNTLRVNDRCGMIFGNGYAVNFLEEYYAANSDPGPRRAAEIAYKAISSVLARSYMFQRLARQYQAEIWIDGRRIEMPTYGMALMGTVEHIGIGFRTLYRAHEAAERFHAVITALSPGKILAQIHRFYSGKELVGRWHVDDTARKVEIRTPEPLGYTLDGEFYADDTLTITLGPAVPLILR